MKTKILSILSGVLAVILSACSTDFAPEPDTPSGKGGSILSLEIQKQDLTRGVITSTYFEKGDSVFVVVRDTKNPDPLTFTSAAVFDGEKWILKEKIDLSAEISGVAWTSAYVDVYYPYSIFAETFDPIIHKVNLSAIKNLLDQVDILNGYATGIDKDNPTAKISCNHLKTRLTFALKNHSDTPILITKMSVTAEGNFSFLRKRGDCWSSKYDPNDFTRDYSMSCNLQIPAGETANLDFLLADTQSLYKNMAWQIGEEEDFQKTVLKFTLDGGDRIFNFDIDGASWGYNYQYIYPVDIMIDRSIGKPIESITISGSDSNGVAIKDNLMVVIQNISTEEWSGPYTAVYDNSLSNYVINDFTFALEADTNYVVFAVSGNTRWDSSGYVTFSEDDYNMGKDQTPIYWGATEVAWNYPHLKMILSQWTSSITVAYPAQWGKIYNLILEDEKQGLPGNSFYLWGKKNFDTSKFYYGRQDGGSVLNNDGTEYQLTFNIFPVTLVSEYCSITLPLESGNRKFTCPDLKIESGHDYLINITSDGLEVSDVTVKTWEDNNVGDITIKPKF